MRSSWRIETMVLPEQIEQNFEGQSFLILTNRSCVWPVNHSYPALLRLKWVPLKCRCNLSLTTGSVNQSKNAWKGSALNHIHTLLALVNTTHTPLFLQLTTLVLWNYVPQTQTSYLVIMMIRGHDQQVGDMTNWRAVHHQSVSKPLCEIWQPNTTQ